MSKKQEIEAACIRQGERLKAEYGDAPLPSRIIISAVMDDCDCGSNEVLPSDRCYDRTNNGIRKRDGVFWNGARLFLRPIQDQYFYVGPEYCDSPGFSDIGEGVVYAACAGACSDSN